MNVQYDESKSAARGAKGPPVSGDLLIARRAARADVYAISVVPTAALLTSVRYPEAIEVVSELARRREVDAWYTCDHTHFVPIARHRP